MFNAMKSDEIAHFASLLFSEREVMHNLMVCALYRGNRRFRSTRWLKNICRDLETSKRENEKEMSNQSLRSRSIKLSALPNVEGKTGYNVAHYCNGGGFSLYLQRTETVGSSLVCGVALMLGDLCDILTGIKIKPPIFAKYLSEKQIIPINFALYRVAGCRSRPLILVSDIYICLPVLLIQNCSLLDY